MRKTASEKDNKELLSYFTYITRIGQIMVEQNKNKCKEDILDIEITTKDRFAGMYAEILSRMGESEENIAIALKEDPLLDYKNGEELYYCKKNV